MLTARESLRRWRGQRSQREVAEDLGVDQSTFSRLERGEIAPGLGLAIRIEAASDGVVKAGAWVRRRAKKAA